MNAGVSRAKTMKKGPKPAMTLLRGGRGQDPGIGSVLQRARHLSRLAKAIRKRLPVDLAEHALVANTRGDRVIMIVESAAWATRLRFHPTGFLAGLESPEGQPLRRVEVKVRPLSREPRPVRQPRIPSAAVGEELNSVADGIADEELAQALRRLARNART